MVTYLPPGHTIVAVNTVCTWTDKGHYRTGRGGYLEDLFHSEYANVESMFLIMFLQVLRSRDSKVWDRKR